MSGDAKVASNPYVTVVLIARLSNYMPNWNMSIYLELHKEKANMAWIGLIVVVAFIAAVLSALPRNTYRCSECGWETPYRQDAAGHQKLMELHKMNL